jgi:hypothetical protein
MKRITAQVAIGGSVQESAANTFTEAVIQIPLSPVDRQGFVIQECYIMSSEPSSVAGITCTQDVRVSKTSQTGLINVDNPMLISAQQKLVNWQGASTDSNMWDLAIGPTSEGQSDYITILATTDAYISINGVGNLAAKHAEVRLVGYFAELSSNEYNALVLDELQ